MQTMIESCWLQWKCSSSVRILCDIKSRISSI